MKISLSNIGLELAQGASVIATFAPAVLGIPGLPHWMAVLVGIAATIAKEIANPSIPAAPATTGTK